MNAFSDVRPPFSQPGLKAGGLSLWRAVWLRQHTRRALLQLSDEQLLDIGLTPQDARREAAKPFWK
ncbi:DUF1127 domain-containing protein [Pseudomonas sp. nanlin1]|uniref:DUF1127 domain-containing protein n=1 Tax=Pseudomonas sp. nanlin1 TaxID=3040605 RepID=UPI0038902F8D